MALSRSRRADRGIDYWPGFVDALSTLVLSVVFLMSIFTLVQYFMSQQASERDTVLGRLNAQIAQLTELLSLERGNRQSLEGDLAALTATLGAITGERDRLRGAVEGATGGAQSAQGRIDQLQGALNAERDVTGRALAQVELLNQQIAALRRQLAGIEQALEAAETRERDSQGRIADLGRRLNVALAQRVQELQSFRSEFFGRIRQIIGDRPDIRIVGDRFVFQSEVFFDPGQAILRPEGRAQLDTVIQAVREIERRIPPEINWVLRVDGHTDARPIQTAQFPSNWALSAARSISVVQYIISQGISPQRLVAAGFGEFQPLDTTASDEAFARNRRIELKLTER
jgi:chemotaxis protein MotB